MFLPATFAEIVLGIKSSLSAFFFGIKLWLKFTGNKLSSPLPCTIAVTAGKFFANFLFFLASSRFKIMSEAPSPQNAIISHLEANSSRINCSVSVFPCESEIARITACSFCASSIAAVSEHIK